MSLKKYITHQKDNNKFASISLSKRMDIFDVFISISKSRIIYTIKYLNTK